MRLNPSDRTLQKAANTCQRLLANKKVLVCSKNKLTLTALLLCTPIFQSLVGGATTEDEALEIQQECQPDLLITSEDLEKMVAERDGKEIFEECRYMFSTRSLILYPEDYEKLFNEAGFDVLKAGGDATLRPFDKEEDTGMYMIARRR